MSSKTYRCLTIASKVLVPFRLSLLLFLDLILLLGFVVLVQVVATWEVY